LQTTLILPMLNALRRVFKKMVGSDSVIGRPTVLRAWREEPNWVVAVIPVRGDESGAFAIYMANTTADAIAKELVDADAQLSAGSARENALCEMARMMVSIARRDKRLGGVELDSPIVRSTGPIGDMPQKLRPWVTVPIATSPGQIMVGLSLNAKKTVPGTSEADTDQALESIA